MKREEYKQTHSNPAMAFKNHCDYACAVEVHSKTSPWWYVGIVCVCALSFVAIVVVQL